MLVPRWFLLPSKLHISKISNMPYDRLCLRSLYPPLLLLYITCQVRYMCMNLSKIYSYRKDIFLRKINTPMGNMKFLSKNKDFLWKLKFREDWENPMGYLYFLYEIYLSESNSYRKYLSRVWSIVPAGF